MVPYCRDGLEVLCILGSGVARCCIATYSTFILLTLLVCLDLPCTCLIVLYCILLQNKSKQYIQSQRFIMYGSVMQRRHFNAMPCHTKDGVIDVSRDGFMALMDALLDAIDARHILSYFAGMRNVCTMYARGYVSKV